MKARSQFSQSIAAAKANFSERTARRIDQAVALPSQRQKAPRAYRTRQDPLAELWPSIEPMLVASPGLLAVTIFEELQDQLGPDRVPDSIRRTLERRVRRWKAMHGPGQETFFPQVHPPGERGLTDFTDAADLNVIVAGQPFPHRLFHFRLACSGWEHAEVIIGGESFTALATGLQNALWRLGGVPREHRTDSLSAAFRNLTPDQQDDATRRYQQLCQHYGMIPTRNNRGEAHENGTIEAANYHLKRRLDQNLKRRGHRDFDTLDKYRAFVAAVIDRHNGRRQNQVQAEVAHLKPLPERRTTDFTETTAVVTRNGTIAVEKVTYSVPAKLVGQKLRIHLTDDRLKAFLGPDPVFETDRVRANRPHRGRAIDYRHMIDSLIKKPGAFQNYVFRDQLFPRDEYRRAWMALTAALKPRDACKIMVGLLHLAAKNACEEALARQLADIIAAGQVPDLEALRATFAPPIPAVPPDSIAVDPANPTIYDLLLTTTATFTQETWS